MRILHYPCLQSRNAFIMAKWSRKKGLSRRQFLTASILSQCLNSAPNNIFLSQYYRLVYKLTGIPDPASGPGKDSACWEEDFGKELVETDPWSQINWLICLDRRQYWSALRNRSYRQADCDVDAYLTVASVRDKPAVSKEHKNFISKGSSWRN
jgi:hypothetical protein